jgi:hypothetical protein
MTIDTSMVIFFFSVIIVFIILKVLIDCDSVKAAFIFLLSYIGLVCLHLSICSYASDYFKTNRNYHTITCQIIQHTNSKGEIKQSFNVDTVIDNQLIEKTITLDKVYDITNKIVIYKIQSNQLSYFYLNDGQHTDYEVIDKN